PCCRANKWRIVVITPVYSSYSLLKRPGCVPLAVNGSFCKNLTDLPNTQSLKRGTPLSILAPPTPSSPPSAAETLPPDRSIGSLWRRFVAFAVDGIIVGVAGTVVALPFFEAFSHLGPWGRL